MRTLRQLLHRAAGKVELCDRCGTVCDQDCRAARLRDQAVLRGLEAGPGPRGL